MPIPERRDAHKRILKTTTPPSPPPPLHRPSARSIAGAICAGSPNTKGHSLVCQVSAGCRSSPQRLETDDDLIRKGGGARKQAPVQMWGWGGVSAGEGGKGSSSPGHTELLVCQVGDI